MEWKLTLQGTYGSNMNGFWWVVGEIYPTWETFNIKLWSYSTNGMESRTNERLNKHTNGKTKTIYPSAKCRRYKNAILSVSIIKGWVFGIARRFGIARSPSTRSSIFVCCRKMWNVNERAMTKNPDNPVPRPAQDTNRERNTNTKNGIKCKTAKAESQENSRYQKSQHIRLT